MSRKDITKIFKKYQKAPSKKRGEYLRAFEEEMIYRTTKTENPETTRNMVRRVLNDRERINYRDNQTQRRNKL